MCICVFFFFQAEDGIRDLIVTGVQTCALPILQLGGKGGFFDVRGVQIPVAVMAYPDEIYQAPQSWAVRAYPKLLRYNRLPKGGHFAAWEQPETFVSELRAGFKSLRSAS